MMVTEFEFNVRIEHENDDDLHDYVRDVICAVEAIGHKVVGN